MAQLSGITPAFYRNLVSIGSIVVGVMYIESHVSSTIKEAIEPLARKVESTETRLNGIEPKVLLNDYKLLILDDRMKELLKPEEPEVPKRK